jgi:transcriptional regulator with PAS, ATPase and Fis domain
VLDCGAIPAGLLESELFGHERGAFTGADRERIGAFEAAHGGTLLLDEVGELDLGLQPKLLRVLETRAVQRVGGARRIDVDVRVVAATNRNLPAEVNARRFRSDLYYRLAVLEVTLPPLRDRTEDLPLLVEEILSQLGATADAAAADLRSGTWSANLLRHPWPGNVRELRNHVERCLALQDLVPLSPDPQGGADALVDVRQPLRAARDRWVRFFEKKYLAELLSQHGNNVSAAARAAGVDRIHFHRLLSRCGLR